ncbi:hypothetical protein HDK77DRAFT_295574 [Phyllosticta capitalensis]
MYSTRPKLSSFSKHPSRLLSRAVAASRPCIQSIYLATRGLHVVLCVCVCVCVGLVRVQRAVCTRAPWPLRPAVRPAVPSYVLLSTIMFPCIFLHKWCPYPITCASQSVGRVSPSCTYLSLSLYMPGATVQRSAAQRGAARSSTWTGGCS